MNRTLIKMLPMIVMFVVSWKLDFQRGEVMTTTLRQKAFWTRAEAEEFMSHRPFYFKVFECINSDNGLDGHCAIHDMQLEVRQ